MSRAAVVTIALLVTAVAAQAEIIPHVEWGYQGYLSDGTTYVYSFDLKVDVIGDDAWTLAAGVEVGEPWVVVTGGTFYQDPDNDTNPPDPGAFAEFPDSEHTSFYTTHLGYPNVPDIGVGPSFAYGPADTPTGLVADWYLVPDGNDYPGTFTLARFTVVPNEGEGAWVVVDMMISSRDTISQYYHWESPEPGTLTLLTVGGLALLRRR